MRISARGISKGRVLPQTTVHVHSGEVRLVPVEGGQRPSVLALLLSGRMAPDTGEVTADGEVDHRRLRDAVAVVDAPDVSAPYDDLTLGDVLREELAYARVRGVRATAARLLAEWDAAGHRGTRLRDVPAGLRVRALAEAAALREGTEAVLIVAPDRHGGDPADWHAVARDLADRGLAVAALAGAAAIAALQGAAGEPEEGTEPADAPDAADGSDALDAPREPDASDGPVETPVPEPPGEPDAAVTAPIAAADGADTQIIDAQVVDTQFIDTRESAS